MKPYNTHNRDVTTFPFGPIKLTSTSNKIFCYPKFTFTANIYFRNRDF